MWVGSGRSTLCASANGELGTLADNNPLTPSVISHLEEDEHTAKTTKPNEKQTQTKQMRT